ncbi:D(2) dopamine receptor A [Exaiptasia diaphana]|uniref:G-protein coupled receptors family 1 profile domain-containing protein n=1 Tax=Exaiptasia diaphana TaxID=2652724 RepID=A0A913X0H2_EXADI|nr:D(2) dopamine receptor A [Exaiptasia diaphana]
MTGLANNSSVSKPMIMFPTLPNDEIEVIGSTVVYILLCLAIIFGNGLVIAAYRYNHRLQTVTNTFLVGLAVSDLLVGLISVPLWIYFSVCQQYKTCTRDPGVNIFYVTADIFVGCASVLQLTAMSIERFLAITRPIIHRTYSARLYTTMIIMAWLYAFIMAILFPVQYHRWQKVYTVILVSTCFAAPTIMIIVVYVMIFKAAMFSSEVRVSPEGSQKRSLQQEAKIAVTIAVITGLFVLAWLPFFVVNVIGTFSPERFPKFPEALRLFRFVKWMHYSNSVVNPLIYAYRNREMRRTFIRIMRTFCCCSCVEESLPMQSFSVQKRSQAQRSSFKSAKRDISLTRNMDKNSNVEETPSSQLNNANMNRLSEPFESGVRIGDRNHDNNHNKRCVTFQGVEVICKKDGSQLVNQV